jgi:hypothetical protein
MFKNPRFSRRFTQAAVASGLAIAFLPAFAADFPTGSFIVEGTTPTLTFDDKGRFHVEEGQKTQVTGTYTVKGGEIQFTDKDGPWACTKDDEKTGTYRWKYENSVLTFTKVMDACADRVGSLATAKWKQSQSK